MRAQVADVDEINLQATQHSAEAAGPAGAATARPRAAGKFVYHGGSRPLEGYTLKRGVGQGGFGEIYYAVSDAGKEVALKLIRRNLDVELRGIRQCLNLKHPNLLDLYDIRQDDQGDTWVVMEFVAGQSLEDALIAHPDGLPVAAVLAWIQGIGAGVAYLHDHGIVHRDLKPGNIFSNEGLVKIGDYGLSKFISCSRRSGHTESIGTVHYMAPEVANGRYGKEIDVYAMGVILYEMLTGCVPFDGESVGEVLMKHLTAQPDVSMIAEPYCSVVARALEKDPERRFRSAQEMLAALPATAASPLGRLPSGAGAYIAGDGLLGNGHSGASGTAADAEEVPVFADAAPASGRTPVTPLTETVVHAQAVDEEPIWRAVRESARKLRRAWNDANLNTPAKIGLLILAMLLLLQAAGVIIPLAFVLCGLYACYFVVRLVVLSFNRPPDRARQWPRSPRPVASPSAPPRRAPPPPQPPPARAYRWQQRYQRATAALVVKPRRERLVDLLGSLLLGAVVTAAMSVVMVLLMGYNSSMPRPEQIAWLVLMSLAGTWSVLIPAKLWEGTRGEAILRRFVMLVIGLGLGAAAFALANVLLVTLPFDNNVFPEPIAYQLPAFYSADSRPLAMAYLACFGTLFGVLRWWRQADPLRATRLSFWSLIVSVVVASVVAAAWHFPQPWLPMLAGTMSVAIQLAAPWGNPRELRRA